MHPVRYAIRFAALAACAVPSAYAAAAAIPANNTRDVDLVIALDISSSMDGLIDSAKQRLWDITNELARAQPTPHLRVAILSYGRPSYGEQSGFVHVDLPFTTDLDAVNATLFEFRTDGGDEYVARAIQTSLDALSWSQDADALQIVFVAGNESAAQDPRLTLESATQAAARRGIVVNAIYCGGNDDGDALAWRSVATSTNGRYASIDQNAAAVAQIATPFDAPLAALNDVLNGTYVAFGTGGALRRANQVAQDRNAAAMSPATSASRTVAKASELYRPEWDLVDALESGTVLAAVAVDELPAELQALTPVERETYLREKAELRDGLQRQIGELAAERNRFIAEQAPAAGRGLDTAILEGVRDVAATKGFSFDGE